MKVRFLKAATSDLRRITDYIAVDNPSAARRLVQQIDAHLELVAATGFTEMARAGRRPGTREFVEGRYIITYRYHAAADEILVVSVIHGARRR